MLSIPCPWCDESGTFSLADVQEPEVPFTCQACGTSVILVEDLACALETAA